MRIRRQAAKILSPWWIPTRSCAAAVAAADAAGRELQTHVCELNQSPWDAMDFTGPPGIAPLYLYQEAEKMEEDNGVVGGAAGGGQREEEPGVASDVIGSTTVTPLTSRRHAKTEETVEAAEQEDRRERKMEAKKRNASYNTKKIKRKSSSSCSLMEGSGVGKVKVGVESAAAAVLTCKKSDGKGWHCKREAQRPHSLCEYHLTQVRSYYSNGGGTAFVLQQQSSFRKIPGGADAKENVANAPDGKVMKKRKTKRKDGCNGSISRNGAAGRTRRKPASDFYYYYSGFGPWWRQRRSGGHSEDASDGDGGAGASDGALSPWVHHDQAPDDLDDDGVDMDGVDDLGDYEADDVVACKRRGRKPVKARSLKSLL